MAIKSLLKEKNGKTLLNNLLYNIEEFADLLFQLMYIVNKQSIKLMNI